MKLMMSLALIAILGATAGAETPQINASNYVSCDSRKLNTIRP
jgi:hypothetical protein